MVIHCKFSLPMVSESSFNSSILSVRLWVKKDLRGEKDLGGETMEHEVLAP